MPADSRPVIDGQGGDLVGEIVLAAARVFALRSSLTIVAEGVRGLTGARYAAVGLPAQEPGEFSHFVTAGLSDDEIEAIGPLPRAHGLLGAVLADPRPQRVADIRADPRASGWWPSAHPAMSTLLAVPMLVGDALVGALYAANEAGGPAFDAADQTQLARLADHAAPLVRALRRNDDDRLLTLTAERQRIARDLHDALSQTLFSIGLRAEAAEREIGSAPERASEQLGRIAELAGAARGQLAAVVEGLRPAAVDEEGLAPALARVAALLDRLGGARVTADLAPVPDLAPERAREAFLILQEALVNAVRHAEADAVLLQLADDGRELRAEVRDDGIGFDPSDPGVRARRMGLNAMRERTDAAGGELEVASVPGRGTRVSLRLPHA
jgi:signal transduction histidine kinase